MTKITTYKPSYADSVVSIMRNTADGIHPTFSMKVFKNREYGSMYGTFCWGPWTLLDAGHGVGNCVVLEVTANVANWIKEQDTGLYAFSESTSWARKVNVSPSLFTLLALKFS